MNNLYRRWAIGFLAALLALLSLCGAFVCVVDPCLYYRAPEDGRAVFFNERYQAAGLAKNVPADTVILGTSMAANYRAGWIENVYHTSGLRITIPDGYFSEFDQVMRVLFREQAPKRILFALDLNTLIRDDQDVSSAMPDYFYNQNPVDDLKYLLNKDSLYYSLYTLKSRWEGKGETLDEGFTWDKTSLWGKYETLRTYNRPPLSETQKPEGAYLTFTAENLAVLEGWFLEHPDTQFEVFLSPYSILAWDRAIRQGDLDARFKALELACNTLAGSYENVRLHAPLFEKGMVTSLGNYCDYVHHSGEAGKWVLGNLAAGKFLLKPEDVGAALADWRDFVVNYDYESLWDEAFWEKWNATHDAPPSWWEGGKAEESGGFSG